MKQKRKLKKKPIIILIVFISLILLITLFLVFKDSFIKKVETPKTLEKDETISLSMLVAGNIVLNQNMIKDALIQGNTYKFDYLFKDIDVLENNYDLKYYNQESIIGGQDLGYSLNDLYNSPKEIGDAMISRGFNLISLANYHSFDKRESGIKNSLDYFKTKNILYSGQNKSEIKDISIKTIKGLKYTMLSYTMNTQNKLTKDKEYLISLYDKEIVKKDIERVRKDVDLLIVSISWDNLKNGEVTKEQIDVANYLSSLGVDILIGNGLYSIQPIDKINNMLVIYSSGNLLSNFSVVDSDTSIATKLNINFKKEKGVVNKLTFNDITSYMLYTSGKNETNFKINKYGSLNESILKNYNDYYEKYSNVLKSKIDVVVKK